MDLKLITVCAEMSTKLSENNVEQNSQILSKVMETK